MYLLRVWRAVCDLNHLVALAEMLVHEYYKEYYIRYNYLGKGQENRLKNSSFKIPGQNGEGRLFTTRHQNSYSYAARIWRQDCVLLQILLKLADLLENTVFSLKVA